MKLRKVLATAAIVSTLVTPSFAIVGAGFHWGFDFTSSMTDNPKDDIYTVKDLKLDANLGIDETMSFLNLSRTEFERTPINFGGKIFFDMLPIEFELSVNMGVWQYEGALNYISSDVTNLVNQTPVYTSSPITIKEFSGMNFFGVEQTPYGKFLVDLSVKKTFEKVPVVKPSIGLGASLNFATPVLSSDLVKSALNLTEDISEMVDNGELQKLLANPDNMKKILDEILDGAKDPFPGMHFLIGLKVKPPILPLALYADGKYMFIFDNKQESLGIESKGLYLNIGLLFTI